VRERERERNVMCVRAAEILSGFQIHVDGSRDRPQGSRNYLLALMSVAAPGSLLSLVFHDFYD